ncbi:hypothetical protein REPUB_Repub14bG0035000 [Reevesia pubescens]
MEHPHNAVLLRCSSFEKGCLPFMCNTSYRHSNCLDQFCMSSVSSPSTAMLQEIPLGSMTSSSRSWRSLSSFYDQAEAGSDLQPKLLCPLCRGEIYGWSVVEPARQFMNSKARSCSSETCNFSGTYSELRKHARSDHPLVRPTEVDPDRQRDWTRLERDRDYEDMLSSIQSVAGEESNGESISDLEDFRSSLTIQLAYLTLALEFISHSRNTEQVQFRSRLGSRRSRHDREFISHSRNTEQVQFRRRLGSRRSRYDRESGRGTRDHGTREHSSSVPDRAFLGHRNNPSAVDRFQGGHRSSQGMLRWRHSSSPSERVFRGRHQSSQADRTRG